MFWALLVAASSVLVGWAVLRRLHCEPDGGLVLFSAAIGLGILALGVAALGLAGHFDGAHGGLVFLLLNVGSAVVVLCTRPPGRGTISRWLRGLKAWRPDAITVLLTLVIAALAILTLIGSLAPPTSTEWDALAYHLAVPKVWLHDGRIHPLPYDSHASFPMLTEMLFSVGLAFKSVAAAKLVHWLFGMLGALACYWAGRQWVSRKAGLLAAALFLACPAVVWEATTAYIDLASTLYVTLAAFAFIRWREGAGRGWLVVSALMAGFACGTKMTMVATTGLLVLWAFGAAALKRASWKDAALFTLIAALVGAPWYLKTWIWTGNPVYPFFYGVFGGKWWSAQAAADYVAEQARFGIGKTPYAFLVAPWATAFFAHYYANPPAVFDGALKDARGGQLFPAVFATLGLGWVMFVPLWLMRPRDHAPGALRSMLLYALAFGLVWFGLTHQSRYLLPVLPLLLVPAAAGARAFWHAGRGWRVAVGAAASVCLLWGLLPAAFLALPAAPVAFGQESQDAYLRRTEPVYVLSQAVNEQLPPDAKLLFLQETRGFYIDRAYQWGNPSQNALIPWESLRSPAEMNSLLRTQGITHVLVNWHDTTPATEAERWPALARAAIAQGRWKPVIMMGKNPFGGFGVYQIASP